MLPSAHSPDKSEARPSFLRTEGVPLSYSQSYFLFFNWWLCVQDRQVRQPKSFPLGIDSLRFESCMRFIVRDF
jgi:hypothetical protein